MAHLTRLKVCLRACDVKAHATDLYRVEAPRTHLMSLHAILKSSCATLKYLEISLHGSFEHSDLQPRALRVTKLVFPCLIYLKMLMPNAGFDGEYAFLCSLACHIASTSNNLVAMDIDGTVPRDQMDRLFKFDTLPNLAALHIMRLDSGNGWSIDIDNGQGVATLFRSLKTAAATHLQKLGVANISAVNVPSIPSWLQDLHILGAELEDIDVLVTALQNSAFLPNLEYLQINAFTREARIGRLASLAQTVLAVCSARNIEVHLTPPRWLQSSTMKNVWTDDNPQDFDEAMRWLYP